MNTPANDNALPVILTLCTACEDRATCRDSDLCAVCNDDVALRFAEGDFDEFPYDLGDIEAANYFPGKF